MKHLWENLIHPAATLPGNTRTRRVLLGLRVVAIALILTLVASQGYTAPKGQAALINQKISGDILDLGDVQFDLLVSPDGRFVVFRADKDEDEKIELYSVALNGSSPVKISGTLGASEDVAFFRITRDSRHVVFTTALAGGFQTQLFSAPIAGGEDPTELNVALPTNGYISGFWVAQNSRRVVYQVDSSVNNDQELFSTDIHFAEGISLYALDPGSTGDIYIVTLTKDSARVVFSHRSTTVDPLTLSFVQIMGGTVTDLHSGVNRFLISPDSQGVAYVDATTLRFKYFTAPLTAYTIANADTYTGYSFSPDSQKILYTDTFVSRELFIRSREGGPQIPLSGALATDGYVYDFRVTPDGQFVVYQAAQRNNDIMELFVVPVTGGTPIPLSGNLQLDENVNSFEIAPNSKSVVFLADKDVDEKFDLFLWPAPESSSKINGPIVPAGGDVKNYAILPNSLGVVYRADQDADERDELYVRIANFANAFKLNPTLVTDGDVYVFAVLPDSQGVVYLADQEANDKLELFMTREELWAKAYLPEVVK